MPALVLFTAASRVFALPAEQVVAVLRMAAPTPVPGAPPHFRGVLDLRGALVPVIDVAARLGAPPRPPSPAHQLLVVADGGRRVALEVERVLEVREVPEGAIDAGAVEAAASPLVRAAARLPEGVVLVQALGAWLAEAEVAAAGAGPAPGAGAAP